MKQAFKIAVFYYTQTGQALAIAQKMCEPLAKAGCSVVYKEIVPERPYPFPWSANDFFQVFPESRLGIACPLKPFDLNDVHDADLVRPQGQGRPPLLHQRGLPALHPRRRPGQRRIRGLQKVLSVGPSDRPNSRTGRSAKPIGMSGVVLDSGL